MTLHGHMMLSVPLSHPKIHSSVSLKVAFCRGYLAKGALFKENGRKADAQRMFIQARFYAPSEARAIVEQIATR